MTPKIKLTDRDDPAQVERRRLQAEKKESPAEEEDGENVNRR